VIENNANNEASARQNDAKTAKNAKSISAGQRWRKTALHNKILAVVAIITAISGVVYVGTVIIQIILVERHRREDRRPLVVHNRPPRLLQPLTCDPEEKRVTFGNLRFFIKNIGNDTAEQVFPFPGDVKLVPINKTGDARWDDPPAAHCDVVPKPSATPLFSLIPGEDRVMQIRQGFITNLPFLRKGDMVQLYREDCVYYSDHDGTQHAFCDSYLFVVPSDDPLDRLIGTTNFRCDGTPRSGEFRATLTGRCIK
jgi:hypothetical protein